ncbi:MAG: hypothetical protein IKE75_03850 [Bacilli bacterium]|nr:hypothetical protein [Bacilli bacterium]
MTLETLNELAEKTQDSKDTIAGEILFFRKNSSVGESLKKLKNHNFKIGYSFTLTIGNNEYTKIVAYNQKNDIFSGWSGCIYEEGEPRVVFPIIGNGFSCYLNMPRIDSYGKLKLYKENLASANRQTSYAKKMFKDLDNIEEINDPSLYETYWPILENPEIEKYRRLNLNKNRELYSDVAALCNIYKFDETYDLLDEGLKRIYKTLLENREEVFCDKYKQYYDNEEVIEKSLEALSLTEEDVQDIFTKNNLKYPSKTIENKDDTSPIIKKLKNSPFYKRISKY